MRTYYLPYTEPCDACDASGYTDNPEWAVYYEETEGYPGLSPKKWTKKTKRWFRKRGFARLPDEVILCYKCGGAGIVTGLAVVKP